MSDAPPPICIMSPLVLVVTNQHTGGLTHGDVPRSLALALVRVSTASQLARSCLNTLSDEFFPRRSSRSPITSFCAAATICGCLARPPTRRRPFDVQYASAPDLSVSHPGSLAMVATASLHTPAQHICNGHAKFAFPGQSGSNSTAL